MNEQDYLKARLQDQIDWYERKSRSAQYWFKGLRTTEMLAAALIPFLTSFTGTYPLVTWIIGALGVVVAVLAGLLGLYQFQERWIAYRTTCEALKREKYLFLTQSGMYTGGSAFGLLVQRVEDLVAHETEQWQSYMRAVTTKAATAAPIAVTDAGKTEALPDQGNAKPTTAADDIDIESLPVDMGTLKK